MYCVLKGEYLGFTKKEAKVNDDGKLVDGFNVLDILVNSPVSGRIIEKVKSKLGVAISFKAGPVELPVECRAWAMGANHGLSVVYTPPAGG